MRNDCIDARSEGTIDGQKTAKMQKSRFFNREVFSSKKKFGEEFDLN